MAILTDEHKLHLVQCLACDDSPTEAAESLKAEFGVEVGRQQVQQYDPTKAAGRHMAKKWRDLFAATRKAYLAETAQVPIANKTYRLRKMQALLAEPRVRRNAPLFLDVLERAAKEQGGHYTNRRELTGAGGGPVHLKNDVAMSLSDDDLARIAAQGLQKATEKTP